MSNDTPTHLLAYPRHCPQCGSDYPTFAEYMVATSALPGPAVEARPGVIETQRACACGATLAACFSDRRGSSGNASLREQFDQVLATLAELGLPQNDVRIELRKVLNGEPDQLLGQIYDKAA